MRNMRGGFFIYFDMFIDELKSKLNLEDKILPFTVTLLGGECTVVCGVKTILLMGQNIIKLRLGGRVLEICGEGLSVVEIGGGDVYVKGVVNSVAFV